MLNDFYKGAHYTLVIKDDAIHFQEGNMHLNSTPLIFAGLLSLIASALHLAIIIGGPQWYRFFGAGEKMATLAEQGSWYPTVITSCIALILFIWGLFAFSGAGLITRLPLLKTGLVIITGIYLLRGVGGYILTMLPQFHNSPDYSLEFWLISSTICLLFGLTHLYGLVKNWYHL